MIEQLEPAWFRRQRRLEERDGCIRELAAYYVELGRGRAIAAAVAKDMLRYQTSGWQLEQGKPPAGDPRRVLMHRIFSLDGKGVGKDRIREILAGMAGKHRR